MRYVTPEEAQILLSDLIDAAVDGEEIYIVKEETVVRLVPQPLRSHRRRFGSAQWLISMPPDFDEPLEEFNCR